jgi:hypothetical protein
MIRPAVARFAFVVGCVLALAVHAAAEGKTENVIVVTLDGFRWQEVFNGADESYMDARQGGVKDVPGLKKRYLRETTEERRATLMPTA